MVTMDGKPQARAWFVDEPVGPADPMRRIKERAKQLLRESDRAQVSAAADRVGALVDALAVESLDIEASCDASGLDESGVDSATYLALCLRMAELGELTGDD
jgi:hypothetical protein